MRITISVSATTGFGRSTLGRTVQLWVEQTAKTGRHIVGPVEIARHLFRYPQNVQQLCKYCDATLTYLQTPVPPIVGAVLTYYPTDREISIGYLITPNEDATEPSRFLTPIGFAVNDVVYNYADYTSALDHIWSRIRTL
jgi:hypothetical protein